MKRTAIACALALATLTAHAQSAAPAAAPATATAPRYEARAADVQTLDGIIAALYNVISGPVGQARDWNRLHSLFTPEARMEVVGMKPDGSVVLRRMTVDDYIARSGPHLLELGFFESEKARRSEVFGQLAHVWTTYEARKGSATAEPFMRGINSLQLYNDGKRWWIESLVWRAEDDKLKLPPEYLQGR